MANNKNVANNKLKMNNISKGEAGKIVTFRVLIIVLFDIILGSLFDYVIHAGNNMELTFYLNVRPVLIYVSIALFVLSVAYLAAAKIKKFDTSRHVMPPEMITAATLFFMVSVLLYNTFRLTPYLFFTVMIVASILIAVYYIYTMLLY